MKKLYLALSVFLLLGLGVTGVLVYRARQLDSATKRQPGGRSEVLSEKVAPQKIQADLVLKYSEEKVSSFSGVSLEAGKSVLDLIIDISAREHLPVSYERGAAGAFVSGFGEISSDKDSNTWWLYYVNGQMPTTSVDKYILNEGDVVEFRYEKSPF